MRTTANISLSILLVLSAGACSSSGGDDGGDDDSTERQARLTIVGDEAVRLENGWATELTVRYTDQDGEPLAGDIEFQINGEPGGAFLGATIAETDDDGKAVVTLTAGQSGDAAFLVEANAADAQPVQWDVDVLAKVMDVQGMYSVRSEFDVASGIPGTAGDVINTFIDLTDGANDPATWLLDFLIESIDVDWIEDIASSLRPGLDAALNAALQSLTPDIVDKLLQMGQQLGQVGRHFGTRSTLIVDPGNDVDGALGAQHVLTHLVFAIDGAETSYAMEDLDMENITATPSFSYTATKFQLGDHAFPLSYGSVLLVVLNEIIIPGIDPSANSLGEFLHNLIPCDDVGTFLSEEIGYGSAGFYEGICEIGVDAGANVLVDQLLGIDAAAMVLGIHGDVRWMDTNHDYKVDVLQNGVWEGQMTYSGEPGVLGPSTFHGERMTAPN